MDTDMKQQFYNILSKKEKRSNNFQLCAAKHEQLMENVKSAKNRIKKENRDYWLLRHYDVLNINGEEHLIAPIINDEIRYFAVFEEVFNILKTTHENIGHGGRDRMRKEINLRYKNITVNEIQTFLNICEACLAKRKTDKKNIVVKPMIFSSLNSRCQVDLIDYQSQPDGDYKFIMTYQDHLTKFVVLRPLKSKKAEEVTKQILDIFLLLGAPSVLQSDNGREFCNSIIENLKSMWPELKIVHGKPRHSQSQGSVERANQDVQNILTTWMMDNHSNKWSDGLAFVQFMKNRTLHAGIKRSPYEAMFGQPAKVGLATSKLPKDIIDKITSENELETFLLGENRDAEYVDAENADTEYVDTENVEIENADTENADTENADAENADTGYAKTGIIQDIIIEEIEYSQDIKPILNIKKCEICYSQICDSQVDICVLCTQKIKIQEARREAKENLEKQANRMKHNSDVHCSTAEVGATIRIKIPDVDRGRLDARCILGTILSKTEDGFYKLGTRSGTLKGLYSRSQFSVCPEVIIDKKNVPDEELVLRTVANKQSLGSGQGFIKCGCKNKCVNNRCSCLKKNVLCNSKCHNSMSCSNK